MQNDPEWAWRYESKCKDVDTSYTFTIIENGVEKEQQGDIYYPPRDRRLYKPIADKAKAICWGTGEDDPECPVRKQCLLYAVSMDDTHGVWGGLSHRERSHLLRKFQKLTTKQTFQQWIMESDGGAKAKQFIKQVPR